MSNIREREIAKGDLGTKNFSGRYKKGDLYKKETHEAIDYIAKENE